MRGILSVVLLSATLVCTSAASESNRIEVDLTYEPPKPPEPKCEPSDPSDPKYDPIIRPRLRLGIHFCGEPVGKRSQYRCEGVISFQFGKGRKVAESNVELKSGDASCKRALERWIPEWRLCPNAPDLAYSGKLLVIICGEPALSDQPSKPAEPESPEKPPEPSPILDGIGMMLKQAKPLYDMIFGSR